MFALKTIADLPSGLGIPTGLDRAGVVLVHTGDLALDGDLLLDWAAGWDSGAIITRLAGQLHGAVGGLSGLYVDGDLRVAGAVVNADADSGPMLLITGTLHARQASFGGAYVRIVGDLRVAEVVYAHYNHGQLVVDGQLSALALINDGHAVDVRGKGGHTCIDLSRAWNQDDDTRLPPRLRKLLKNSPLSLGVVVDGLRRGQDLASLATPRTMEEWREVIWRDYTRIGKLPKELRDEAMYLMLLAPQCPLPKPEIQELLSKIPAAKLTPAVRRAAFMLDPRSLLRLPAKFDLQREYEDCFLAVEDPRRFAGEVPAQFMSATMERHMARKPG